ncbi:hypothetical protein KIN20_036230 [Parelaphostrongylus tenuis]|uniref:Replication termination factor 2 n=1 Tax=Parelaphostrongylus tenuis TaxID=148309 RepID=A0AAD5RC85_PARTN|nr:hypothetical protein KIN20_036230 [Parelaphostrongylus tenuis]
MGADGGTIPKRCELVKNKKKAEKLDRSVKNATKWRNCQLSQQPLKKPIIACRYAASHIKGLKDFKELKLKENKDYKGEEVKGDEYLDFNQSEFLCPVTSVPMNGVNGFVVNWKCGCVFSEKALQEVKSDVCHGCSGPWDPNDSVVLYPDDELLEQYKQKLSDERKEKKSKKKNGENDEAQNGVNGETKESSVARIKTAENTIMKKDKSKDGMKKVEKRKAESEIHWIRLNRTLTRSCSPHVKRRRISQLSIGQMFSVSRVVLRHGSAGLEMLSRPTFCRFQHVRFISAKDVFNYTAQTSANVPAMPLPPPPARSVAEILEAGESVLGEFGLISWWKPSSYFRMALESIHIYTDMPWWATIVSATVALRLALIFVPVMSQRLVAKQSQYKKELSDFRQRMESARLEGNNLLQQQIFMEQRDFLKSKDIRLGRQLLILLANGGVFATQFFAIKKMVEVSYPGFSTGGTAWFTDLTAPDAYYALPLISAVTMALVTRVGIEVGTTSDQMSPTMRLGMQYGVPLFIFIVSSQFSTAICVYWCASNMISLLYSGAFRVPAIRKVFNIPPLVQSPTEKRKKNAFREAFANYKAGKTIPPTMAQLKEKDAQQFKKAGRGKPIIRTS